MPENNNLCLNSIFGQGTRALFIERAYQLNDAFENEKARISRAFSGLSIYCEIWS